jgi:MauM/NapG family ferredoxin protein
MRNIPFRRWTQALSLVLFLVLLWMAAFPLVAPVPVDLFLRTDPLVMAGTWISARTMVPGLWLAGAILALTLILGRFFCAMVCPMGTTLDAAERLVGAGRHRKNSGRKLPGGLLRIKYQVLAFILASALLGVSLVFLASPMAWVTRFYALILYPVLCLATDVALGALGPVADTLDLPALAYAQVPTPRFALQWFTVLFMAALFGASFLAPRFWCRYLCPAGAMFAVFSAKPLVRRRVSDACTDCGICRQNCPMAAIGENPSVTDHRECITCLTCVNVCPADAVRFALAGPNGFVPDPGTGDNRRAFMAAGLAGAATAMVSLTGLHQHRRPGPGQMGDPILIRPPGAVPEKDFLAMCIRCGQCMKACPTNTLQPIALNAGLTGFFSPVMTPRRGPCEPKCNVCGRVCPTEALRPLALEEKTWAKVGTAHVLRHKCLAWEWDRKCLVCDEVCPFDAIELRQVPGLIVAVPFVTETRCAGCGFCQHHCPVAPASAIVVEPTGALRLARGSYRTRGQEAGLQLKVRNTPASDPETKEMPFDSGSGGLPPGFTE